MKRYRVMDAHCDTACVLLDKRESLKENSGHVSLAYLSGFESYVQFFAAWVPKEESNPFARAMCLLQNMKDEIAKYSEEICEIHTAKEVEEVLKAGKKGAILSLEDGRSLCGSLENLQKFYDMGVRAIALAWNDNNELTDGIDSPREYGLTEFGKKVVREMNRLGMIVDVSHISVRGFWDVLELSNAPVMASHSNCFSLCNHRRNLTDEQITALIESQGFIGINLYRDFLTETGEADITHVFSHIDHILSLGGENAVGLGSDFDGMRNLPKGIYHVGNYVDLFEKMRERGYSDERIDKITHKNMLNFMKKIKK